MLDGHVYPVYREMIAYYEQLLPKTRGNHGVWALPDGSEYYAWAVRQHTTTDMTPGEVHALELREVARIEAEMDAILRAEGLIEGSVGARVRELGQRPDQLYPDTAEGRAQILADYQTIIDEIDAGLDPYFDVRPKMGVRVERVPEFREKTAPGAYYYPPAFDGSRPGVFYANLRNVAEVQKFGMRTLAYHEAIPGHHFQTTIQQELTGVPETDVVAEIERYLVMPGQALAYKVGMAQIEELRDRARTELGDRFDIREFHNVLLTGGSVPLDILEDMIKQYIAGKQEA